MIRRLQSGFTLIEPMIVVGIVGVLAAVAFPAYQDYTVRAKVAEGPTLATAYKTGISETFQANGPTDMSCTEAQSCARLGIGSVSATAHVAWIQSNAARTLLIRFCPSAATVTVRLSPTGPGTGAAVNLSTAPAGTSFAWTCNVLVDAVKRYVPSDCR